jgi:hypothetical protein
MPGAAASRACHIIPCQTYQINVCAICSEPEWVQQTRDQLDRVRCALARARHVCNELEGVDSDSTGSGALSLHLSSSASFATESPRADDSMPSWAQALSEQCRFLVEEAEHVSKYLDRMQDRRQELRHAAQRLQSSHDRTVQAMREALHNRMVELQADAEQRVATAVADVATQRAQTCAEVRKEEEKYRADLEDQHKNDLMTLDSAWRHRAALVDAQLATYRERVKVLNAELGKAAEATTLQIRERELVYQTKLQQLQLRHDADIRILADKYQEWANDEHIRNQEKMNVVLGNHERMSRVSQDKLDDVQQQFCHVLTEAKRLGLQMDMSTVVRLLPPSALDQIVETPLGSASRAPPMRLLYKEQSTQTSSAVVEPWVEPARATEMLPVALVPGRRGELQLCSIGIQNEVVPLPPFDYRVCGRCGSNDALDPANCVFHPALCPAVGSLLNGPEWHTCRNAHHPASTPGCVRRTSHFYVTTARDRAPSVPEVARKVHFAAAAVAAVAPPGIKPVPSVSAQLARYLRDDK